MNEERALAVAMAVATGWPQATSTGNGRYAVHWLDHDYELVVREVKPSAKTRVRAGDPVTSGLAAIKVTDSQQRVLLGFKAITFDDGSAALELTDPHLYSRIEQRGTGYTHSMAPSSVRSRRNELRQQGYVMDTGRKSNGHIVWRLTSKGKQKVGMSA